MMIMIKLYDILPADQDTSPHAQTMSPRFVTHLLKYHCVLLNKQLVLH
jgi:hypothetical protein